MSFLLLKIFWEIFYTFGLFSFVPSDTLSVAVMLQILASPHSVMRNYIHIFRSYSHIHVTAAESLIFCQISIQCDEQGLHSRCCQ